MNTSSRLSLSCPGNSLTTVSNSALRTRSVLGQASATHSTWSVEAAKVRVARSGRETLDAAFHLNRAVNVLDRHTLTQYGRLTKCGGARAYAGAPLRVRRGGRRPAAGRDHR